MRTSIPSSDQPCLLARPRRPPLPLLRRHRRRLSPRRQRSLRARLQLLRRNRPQPARASRRRDPLLQDRQHRRSLRAETDRRNRPPPLLRADGSAPHHSLAGWPTREEFSLARCKVPDQADASSSVTSRTQRLLVEVPGVLRLPTDSRPKVTSRTSRSRRSEKRSRAALPNRTVRSRPSSSPPNTMRRAALSYAPSSWKWASSTRCPSTTSSSKLWRC